MGRLLLLITLSLVQLQVPVRDQLETPPGGTADIGLDSDAAQPRVVVSRVCNCHR